MPKRVLSGMQPSGPLHIGNLLGALDNWIALQEDYQCFFFVADWHALSTNYEHTGGIREFSKNLVIDWLAAGIDPQRATVFVQSHVPHHAVLHLMLSMIVPIPWLERNPTYKEKQEQLTERDLSTYGFLGYPVLQAADILLYKPDFVPVGKDQLPHLELTREVARRFNSLYGAVFPEPKEHLTQFPKVPGTDGRKMSKSYGNTINLADTEPQVRQKLKTMVTDPARVRRSIPAIRTSVRFTTSTRSSPASPHRAAQPRMPHRRNRLHRLQEACGRSSGRHTGADLGGAGGPGQQPFAHRGDRGGRQPEGRRRGKGHASRSDRGHEDLAGRGDHSWGMKRLAIIVVLGGLSVGPVWAVDPPCVCIPLPSRRAAWKSGRISTGKTVRSSRSSG